MLKYLQFIEGSELVKMDRWYLDVDPHKNVTEKGDPVPLNIMNNYFSIGVVSCVFFIFHLQS